MGNTSCGGVTSPCIPSVPVLNSLNPEWTENLWETFTLTPNNRISPSLKVSLYLYIDITSVTHTIQIDKLCTHIHSSLLSYLLFFTSLHMYLNVYLISIEC